MRAAIKNSLIVVIPYTLTTNNSSYNSSYNSCSFSHAFSIYYIYIDYVYMYRYQSFPFHGCLSPPILTVSPGSTDAYIPSPAIVSQSHPL